MPTCTPSAGPAANTGPGAGPGGIFPATMSAPPARAPRGVEFGRSTRVHFRHNERLRVIFVNDTMMTHPMHLHGMWQELEGPDGRFQGRKPVIRVQPAQRGP